MSDGKMKDSQSEALTAFEIIHGIERKCNALSAKIEVHDQYEEKIKDLQFRLSGLFSDYESHKMSIQKSVNFLSASSDSLDRKVEDRSLKNEMFIKDLDKHKKDHDNLKSHCQDHHDAFSLYIKRMDSSLESVQGQCISKVDFLAHKTDMQSNFIGIHMLLQDQKDALISLDAFKISSFGKIQSLVMSTAEMAEKLSVIEKDSASVSQYVRHLSSELQAKSESLISGVQSKLETDLKISVSNFSAKQSDIDSMQAEVKSKMDVLILEVNNNSLRTYNYEQQLKNLERKVENLQLLLRKYELSQ